MRTQLLSVFFLIGIFLFSIPVCTQDHSLKNHRWTHVEANGEAKGRHENGFVEFQDKFYLIGGRGINPVNVYDPATHSWESLQPTPFEIHHFQPVVHGDVIYIVGAMTGGYPTEVPLEHVWKYYPLEDRWEKGVEIPEARRRGGAGAALYEGKIYLACGIDYGHTSGTTNDFDVFDPKTGSWEVLTRAPHVRDHFPAIVVDDRLYCVGGRNTSVHYEDNFGAFFRATIPQVDVYDFKTGKWHTMKATLPVPTAAGGLVHMDGCLIYMGGEGAWEQAYNTTQCLDLASGTWSQLSPLVIGRHGSGAILYENEIWIAAGSQVRGGGNMSSVEKFSAAHGWKSLFNGKDLEGWQVQCFEKDKGKGYWRVEEGMILSHSLGNKDHGYMWLENEEEFGDFELRLKFSAAEGHKGNSGIQVHSRWDPKAKIQKDGTGWLDGPQVDIEANDPFRNGWIYDETRETRRWIIPSLPNWAISPEDVEKRKVIHYWADEDPGWNDMRIRCEGTRITTWVNGQQIADFNGSGILDDKDHRKNEVGLRGHIAIQLHAHSENNIRFKDIEVQVLN